MDIFEALERIEEPVIVDEREIETKALTHVEQARSVTIRDQGTYDGAIEILTANKLLQKEVIDHHKPIKQAQWEAWQVTITQEKKVLGPLQEAEKILKTAVAKWDIEQARVKAELDRVARETAELERAKEIEAEVVQAEAAGAPVEEIRAIIEQPRPAPRPIVAPTYTKSKAASTALKYGASVTDLKALCRAVADGHASTELVMGLEKDKDTGVISSPALETMARALKSTMAIGGVTLVTGSTVSVRAKR